MARMVEAIGQGKCTGTYRSSALEHSVSLQQFSGLVLLASILRSRISGPIWIDQDQLCWWMQLRITSLYQIKMLRLLEDYRVARLQDIPYLFYSLVRSNIYAVPLSA